jgi:glycerol-3-phosphate acyltransferase PlsY
MTWAALAIAAFLMGSVPTGYLIARSRGVDIRRHGSGPIGATNVLRVLGAGPGALCFVIDLLKGFAPTLAAGLATGALGAPRLSARDGTLWLLVMAAAILGHMYPPWLGFRGGKGIATGLGALLGVYPYLTVPAVAALAVWSLVLAASRYVSLASMVAALLLPIFVVAWAAARAVLVDRVPPEEREAYRDAWLPFFVVTSLLAAMVLVRHRGNIGRLLAGTESRLGQRVPPRP